MRALKAVVIHSSPRANVKLCHQESEKMHIGFRGNLILFKKKINKQKTQEEKHTFSCEVLLLS